MGKISWASILDWLQRGYFVITLILSTGIGQSVKAILLSQTSIPPIWVTPIWLLSTALALATFSWWGKRRSVPGLQQQGDLTRSQNPPHEQVQNVEDFYKRFDNSLLLEAEDLIREQAKTLKTIEEREKFLIRYCASIAIVSMLERTWLLIFRSQVLTLEALNKSPLKTEQLTYFYDAAITAENEDFYKGYSFFKWLGFMKVNLLIREEGDTTYLTIRGKEFLKYMVDNGVTDRDRYN